MHYVLVQQKLGEVMLYRIRAVPLAKVGCVSQIIGDWEKEGDSPVRIQA
jgi:hypothetical protein